MASDRSEATLGPPCQAAGKIFVSESCLFFRLWRWDKREGMRLWEGLCRFGTSMDSRPLPSDTHGNLYLFRQTRPFRYGVMTSASAAAFQGDVSRIECGGSWLCHAAFQRNERKCKKLASGDRSGWRRATLSLTVVPSYRSAKIHGHLVTFSAPAPKRRLDKSSKKKVKERKRK